MKFTLKDRIRLASLKALATPSEADKAELATLVASCKAAKLDPETIARDYAPDGSLEDPNAKSLTDEDLSKLVTDAVVKALPAGSGVDSAKIVSDIKAAVGEKSLTVEAVEAIVVKHVGGTSIDKDALVSAVKAAIPAQTPGLTEDALVKALDNFAASIKSGSKAFGKGSKSAAHASELDFPFEHRMGNLSVGEKQLLNICFANVKEDKRKAASAAGDFVPSSMDDGITAEQLAYATAAGAKHLKALRSSVIYGGKALTTGGANAGAELVPSDLSSDLMARMYLESQIAAEFLASEINMPTPTFTFPLTTTRTNFYVGSEAPGSDPTESTPGTGEIVLTSKKLIGMSNYSYESDEDSIIAILPMLTEGLASGAADALEGAIINGDTTATHQDSDIHAVTGHHAKLFKGLRKYALAGNIKKDISSGGLSADNIVALRKMLKRWGVRPRDLMLVVGPQGYNDLVNLDETLTFDKVGSAAAARVLTGEASSIFGIRIVVSAQCREDLNASGVYDGSTTTKGSVLLVHRPSFIMGVSRGFTVEVDVDKKRQINSVIASFRRAFQPKETPSTSLPFVGIGFNYAA